MTMDAAKELLKTMTESMCAAMRLAYEKANTDVENPDLATKAELCFFILYLIFEDGAFDEAELELFEEAADYTVNRDCWYQMMEVGRVDSDEHYLSQPPEIIRFMQEFDNVLYEIGENFACVDTILTAYKGVGDIYVNLRGYTDEIRKRKLDKFVAMVRNYQKKNSRNPMVKNRPLYPGKSSKELLKDIVDKRKEEKSGNKVIPFQKGVPAPKKS